MDNIVEIRVSDAMVMTRTQIAMKPDSTNLDWRPSSNSLMPRKVLKRHVAMQFLELNP